MKQKQTYRKLLHQISIAKGIDLTYAQMAIDLEMTKQYMNKIKEKEPSAKHKEMLTKIYGITLEDLNLVDAMPIEYFSDPRLTVSTVNSDLPDPSYDRYVLLEKWGLKKEDIKAITMWGETMDGGERPVQNKDVIIIDTSCKDLMQTGVFAYATKNFSRYFISGIRQRSDGLVEFYYHNTQFPSVQKTEEQLQKLDFQIIGRMVKNITYKM